MPDEKPKAESNKLGCQIAGWTFGAIAIVLLIMIAAGESKRTGTASTKGMKSIPTTCFCSEDFDDAVETWLAVSRGDTAAVAGLIARGRAYRIEPGTWVLDTGVNDSGIAAAIIKSGFHTGRKCYTSANALR